MLEPSEKVSQRGIYLLPNLFTTAALFAGFYAIVAAMKGHFDTAAIAIICAMVADGLDGRVARLTNTQSAFGAEYDSLSDMVAFGVAPSLVLYSWSLFSLGKLGWLASFLYTAAAALRLARFNVQISNDKAYFKGLSSTSAAGNVAGLVWVGSVYGVEGVQVAVPLALLSVLLASLMVSSIRYYSFKSIDFKGSVSFLTIVVVILMVCLIALQPAEVVCAALTAYMFSGPLLTIWQIRKVRKYRKH